MTDKLVPYLRLPLSFERGRMACGSMERSIQDNIRLILDNYIQGLAKPEGVAADPEYGSDLSHHNFRRGRIQDVIQEVRSALRRQEPRLAVNKIEFSTGDPGRYLPYSSLQISGKIVQTGETLQLQLRLEE